MKNKWLYIFSSFLIFSLISCGGGTNNGGDNSKKVTITPNDRVTNVSLDSNITIVFSKKVKGIDDINITLTKARSTIDLTYVLTNMDNTSLKLTPTNIFDFNTNYTLIIKKLEDSAGNVINPITTTFTTAPRPSLKGRYLKTGQSTSFVNFDDGYYKKGIDRNYTRKELNTTSGIVIDNITGLMWQDEEYTQAEATAYGNDTEIGKAQHWENAKTYCNNLELGGFHDWRLPNINELESIVDYGRARNNPSGSLGAISSIFKYVGQAGYINYWSSTEYLPQTSKVWSVVFTDGDDYLRDKLKTYYARCVR